MGAAGKSASEPAGSAVRKRSRRSANTEGSNGARIFAIPTTVRVVDARGRGKLGRRAASERTATGYRIPQRHAETLGLAGSQSIPGCYSEPYPLRSVAAGPALVNRNLRFGIGSTVIVATV